MSAHFSRLFALIFAVSCAPVTIVHAGGDAVLPAGLFEAMEAGHVEAKFIPQDTTRANLILRNLTEKPMHVQLPAAFAGVPVLGQMGGMGGMGGGMGGMGGGMGGMGGGGGQAMGGGGMGGGMGGMGGGGMGGMGGGMGGGMFRIEPGRVQKVALPTVCLEHGKPDPTPKMEYRIVPLDQVTKDPAIAALCTALGKGQVAQNTAQAAAWHMMDNLSWAELAAKNRVESKYTGNVAWFSPIELRSAMAVVSEARAIAAKSQSESDYAGSESDDHEKL